MAYENSSSDNTRDSERDLVSRLKAGDSAAYREAIQQYSPRMLGTARRIVGPDQDTQV